MYYVDLCTVCGLVDRGKKKRRKREKEKTGENAKHMCTQYKKIDPWPRRSPEQQYFIHSISIFYETLSKPCKTLIIPKIDDTITMHEISLFYWTSFLKRQ